MIQIITAIISAVSAVIVSVITAIFARSQKAAAVADAAEAERAEERAEEGRLQLRMINANSKLTVGLAMAMKHGHCNGEVETGLQEVQAAEEAYRKYLEDYAIRRIRP